ncbi:hypothetical protein HGRIS_014223 [Hohenbuehelia grisea]|uniref:Fungal-type protein kinase domain-containing protein n=1 Tax=Hohenbuehelia grisea TaxID=104357 RepID=A0ABR3JU51_9AGAR
MNTNQILPKQHDHHPLKLNLNEEVKDITYEANGAAEHVCPFPLETVNKATRLDMIWRPPVTTNSSMVSMRPWPKPDEGELRYYASSVALLDDITTAFEKCSPNEYQSSLFQPVAFTKVSKSTFESLPSECAMQPDLITLINGLAKGGASFYASLLSRNANRDRGRLLLQAGTYALSLFATTDYRAFIPIFIQRHTTSKLRLCFYHRRGILATHFMEFATESGLRGLVFAMAGMWRWKAPSQAGYRPSQPIGTHFADDLTFRTVGVAMLHAVIGHCALFTEGDYLHRDIRTRNILIL